MIDEAINIRSRYALMLFDPRGVVVATYPFEALARTAGASEAEISAHARDGTWLGETPRLSADGRTAELRFGGRDLVLSLGNGTLARAR